MIQKVEILVKADGDYKLVAFIRPEKVESIANSTQEVGDLIQEVADKEVG